MILGFFRIALDLAAKAAHLVVDGAVEGGGAAASCQVEQLISRKYHAGALQQRNQQPELTRRKRHYHAVLVHKFASPGIQ